MSTRGKSKGDDRRRYPRSRRGFSAVRTQSETGVLNHVDNISANGVLCHTAEPIPLMTKMSIALDLPKPTNRRVDCEGIVVRCDPDEAGTDNAYKVAILYTHVSEEDRMAIEEFVAHDLTRAQEAERS